MTTLSRLLASSLVLLCLVGAGCTNDEEQQAAIERNKRIEAQEAKDKADADAKAAQTPAPAETQAPAAESTPEPEQTPEAPPEPEKVNNYNVNGTTCECEERSQCGMSFWRCSNGKTYDCGTNTSYIAVSVNKKDDYADCNYESQN